MRQFTMNIHPDLLLAAKRHALQSDTTLSDLVRSSLAREIGWTLPLDSGPLDDEQATPVLLGYSGGRVTRRQAMQELRLEPEQTMVFVEAMNRLSIPWPQPDPDQIEREAQALVDAIESSDDEG